MYTESIGEIAQNLAAQLNGKHSVFILPGNEEKKYPHILFMAGDRYQDRILPDQTAAILDFAMADGADGEHLALVGILTIDQPGPKEIDVAEPIRMVFYASTRYQPERNVIEMLAEAGSADVWFANANGEIVGALSRRLSDDILEGLQQGIDRAPPAEHQGKAVNITEHEDMAILLSLEEAMFQDEKKRFGQPEARMPKTGELPPAFIGPFSLN